MPSFPLVPLLLLLSSPAAAGVGTGTIAAAADGSGIVISTPGGATLTLSDPVDAGTTSCAGSAVEVNADGACVPKAPAPVLCKGESVEITADGRCAAKTAAVNAATAGYIQSMVENAVLGLGNRVSALESADTVQDTSMAAQKDSIAAQEDSINALTAKFHPETQWECGQIIAYAGACRASVTGASSFLVAVEKGSNGKAACERALCGRVTGVNCGSTNSAMDTVPYCQDGTFRNNDVLACHFNPSCHHGYQHDGYRYGNECADGTPYGAQGFACCTQTDNAGPGPLAGIVLDNARRTGGAFTNILERCPMLDNGCKGNGCIYY